MSVVDTSTAESVQAEVQRLMPTALDMIATVVDAPAFDFEVWSGLMEVAEQNSPLLMIALLRNAAGLAAILDLTGDQVRGLAP